MRKYLCLVALALLCYGFSARAMAASPWGANYFPNISLVTQNGDTVRFFDDLIKDKVVVINFIFTTCVDTCPLETAQLSKVQNILGDRLGRDIFFYSISIDPQHDTPEVLREYADKYQARWDFLTGAEADIVLLRKKLGLYIEEIQDGSNNHNVSMIIGNQRTGQWMKRSPFENPYVLAEQIGSQLTDWKNSPAKESYANAPKLRRISRGEQLFRTRCAICHSIDGADQAGMIGPDLLGVTSKRDQQWLIEWLRAPDQMLARQDPIAMALYQQYNQLAMPNLRLTQTDVMALIRYLDREGHRPRQTVASRPPSTQQAAAFSGDSVAVANAWIREPEPDFEATAGYMTLVNIGPRDVNLVKLESPAFERIEMHETALVDGLPKMREITPLTLAPGAQMRFAPGARHLMLTGPRDLPAQARQVEIILRFASGNAQTVAFALARHAP